MKFARDNGAALSLVISVSLHLIFFAFLADVGHVPPPEIDAGVIDVSIVPQSVLQKRNQITTDSQEDHRILDKKIDSLKLAERDASVEKEQVKRGLEQPPPGSSSQNDERSVQIEKRPEQTRPGAKEYPPETKLSDRQPPVKSNAKGDTSKEPEVREKVIEDKAQKVPPQRAPRLSDLLLSQGELQRDIKEASERDDNSSQSGSKSRADSAEANAPSRNPRPAPYSRPMGSGARFLSSNGTPDLLPNLPDGDITLLNTKAEKYAVFVRRVALQVFGMLRQKGWEDLLFREINEIEGDAVIKAVMNKEGKLLSVTLAASSQNGSFDRIVEQSVRSGATDPHPPVGAEASDGNIHFIFQSRTWTRQTQDPRSRLPVEHRWLFLSTGLE